MNTFLSTLSLKQTNFVDVLFGGRERNKISKDASKFVFEVHLNDDFSNHFRFRLIILDL